MEERALFDIFCRLTTIGKSSGGVTAGLRAVKDEVFLNHSDRNELSGWQPKITRRSQTLADQPISSGFTIF